jgi:Trypsin
VSLFCCLSWCLGDDRDRLEYAVVGLFSSETEGQRGDNSERINIIRHYPNPLWIFEEYSYDQMILVLERDSIHPPVKLNLDPEVPTSNSNITLVGMGRSNSDQANPEVLQETKTLQYIDNAKCQNLTDEDGNEPFQDRLSDDMICVYDQWSSQCSGDSGGPYLLTPTDNYEDDVQVGLVSWSYGGSCGSVPVKWPGVGARTSTEEWIRALTCQHATQGTTPFNFFCDFVDVTFSPAPTRAPSPPTVSPAPSMSTVTLVLILYMDEYPHEVSWSIRSVTTGTLYGEVKENTYIRGTTLVREEMRVLPGDYRLTLEDSAGDGIDSDTTRDGISYEIIIVDEGVKFLLVKKDGDYQTRRVENFSVPEPENYPSESPTVAPTESLSPTMATMTVFLRFDFDDWHKEISWDIISPSAEEDVDDIIWASVDPGTYIAGGVITESVELPLMMEGDFILTVRDSFGDGFGVGGESENGYVLYIEDPVSGRDIVLVEGDGNIGSEVSHPFSITNWTSYPTEAPSETFNDVDAGIDITALDVP